MSYSSDSHHAVIRQLSGSHQAVIRQSSDSQQAVSRQSSGSHQAVFWQSSGSLEPFIKKSPGSHPFQHFHCLPDLILFQFISFSNTYVCSLYVISEEGFSHRKYILCLFFQLTLCNTKSWLFFQLKLSHQYSYSPGSMSSF